MKGVFLSLLLTVNAMASVSLVPWLNNSAYSRNDYQWPLGNCGQSDDLYYNGGFVSSSAGGRYDLKWIPVDCSSVKIGIVDQADAHGAFVEGLIVGGNGLAGIASNAVIDYQVVSFGTSSRQLQQITDAIVACVNDGDRVINLGWGMSTADTGISNACAYAAASNVVICCAVPDNGNNIDVTPDYPSSFGFWNVLPVSNLDRTGAIYGPGAAATGTNVIGAPGRNVESINGTGVAYATGTSFAGAHGAGIVAEMMALYPNQSSEAILQAVRASLAPGDARIAGNLVLPSVDIVRPVIDVDSVQGFSKWVYVIEASIDLQTWTPIAEIYGGEHFNAPTVDCCFFRARIK